MAYKTFNQILAEMARTLQALSGIDVDLVDGSILRSLLEAVAFQGQDLSIRFDNELAAALPEKIFEAFGFARFPAQAAIGSVLFACSTPAPYTLVVPSGTEVSTSDGLTFKTTTQALIPTGGSSVSVPIICTVTGTQGNLAAGTITRLEGGIPGISTVTNPSATSGGADAESLDAQKRRFAEHLIALDRSTAAGLKARILSVRTASGDRIQDVLILDHADDDAIPPGEFRVHLYRKGGVTPALTALVTQILDENRAAGCLYAIVNTTGTPVNLSITMATRQAGVSSSITRAASAYIDALGYGEKLSIENLITRATTSHPANIEVTVITPTADVTTTPTGHLEVGTITVTEVLT